MKVTRHWETKNI